MIECSYQCYECKTEWSGFRVLLDNKKVPHMLNGPGMTVCPQCHHDYIHWTNYDEFAEHYREHIGDGGCGGEVKKEEGK